MPTYHPSLPNPTHSRGLRTALTSLAMAAMTFASHAGPAGPGSLDPMFGADGGKDGTPDGVVGVSLGAGSELAEAVAMQKDGKIIVVGSSTSTGKSRNIVVQRLNPNGSLDKSFGADGGK
ncbi:delta-60 repeat domain-containing protein, partial [Hydrogenophaga sp.]|uniref:delta-60 repeat domain-containing protein n=1 Tax=Hydrogenophaga sp. TaxID=1904254 RepID=UPI0025BE18CC